MKKTSTLALIALLSFSANAQLAPQAEAPLFRHMTEVNAQWRHMDPALESAAMPVHFANEADRIAQHLHLVAAFLRSHGSSGLAPSAKANRHALLNDLDAYADRGIFPQNHVLPYRNPVFIDPIGTACAVGQLMIESGHRELAERISREMNLAYVHDIKCPDVLQWAVEEGFTEDELAWIQPGYPPTTAWSTLGGGTNGPVKVMLGMPDGSMVVAGTFTEAGGVPVQNVALWTGSEFVALGSGVTGVITCGAVVGNDIYLGGNSMDGTNDLVHWNGTSWSYSNVFSGKFAQIFALHALENTLYAAGETLGFIGPDEYVMRLSGQNWEQVPGRFDAPVRCLGEQNGQLIAGGEFSSVQIGNPSYPAQHVAVLDTAGWEQLGDGLDGAVLALLNDAGGTLYAGGAMYANASAVFGLARIVSGASAWEHLMPNLADYIPITPGTTQVRTLFSEGGNLYVGGDFELVQMTTMGRHLAQFTGTPDGFTPLAYFNAPVDALGSNPFISDAFGLYAGGEFTQNVNDTVSYIGETLLGTGIRDVPPAGGISLYPNPAHDQLIVNLVHPVPGPAVLEVLDIGGRAILSQPVSGTTSTIRVAPFAAGTYTLRLMSDEGVRTQPFIKQ